MSNKDIKDEKEKKAFLKRVNNFLINYFKWFVFLLILIVFVCGYYFLLFPKYKEIENTIKSNQEQQQEVFLTKQRTYNKLKDYIDSYNALPQKDLGKIDKILPEAYNQEELFSELNYLIKRNNLILKSVNINSGNSRSEFGEEKPNKNKALNSGAINIPSGVEKFSATLSIVGTNYYSLKNLLYNLENNIKLINITNLSFSPSSQTTNITFDTYYLK
ncbi:hypothetical protein K8R62_01780 [bacterium]|nr:hypothetical protein [bacterium]